MMKAGPKDPLETLLVDKEKKHIHPTKSWGKITRGEYHALVGLLVLGARLQRQLDEVVEEVQSIIGEEREDSVGSHSEDAVYDHQNVDLLLRKLKISVEEGTIPSRARPTTAPEEEAANE